MNQAAQEARVYWESNQAGGWVHVLPPLTGLRLLCLTPYDATAWMLARQCAELVRLRLDDAAHVETEAGQVTDLTAGIADLRLDVLMPMLTSDASARFDGLVVHDPEGLLLHQGSLPVFAALLQQSRRLLSGAGFVYLAVSNPLSFQRVLSRLRLRAHGPAPRPASVRQLTRLLVDAGLGPVRRHAYLMADERVLEVLTPQGYRATKNRELWRERAKEQLLGARGSQVLASAFALVALRDAATPSVVDTLVERLGQLRVPAAAQAEAAVLKQYLVMDAHKAILCIGPKGDDDHDVVAVLAGSELHAMRRRDEVAVLDALSGLSPWLAQRIPQVLGQFAIGGSACFVLNRFPGVTLDLDAPSLEVVTDEALDFIIDLHRESAVPVRQDDTTFEALALPLMDAAISRNPQVAAELQACIEPLRNSLRGLTLPMVWMHGDFKVENVMYSPATRQLTGVIDWEHAKQQGLPLLDALYLLAFNRTIRGVDWLPAIAALALRTDCSDSEVARLARYADALAVPAEAMPALGLLFVAHHIGVRMHLKDEAHMWVELSARIDQLRLALASSSAAAATSDSPPQESPLAHHH